MIYKRYQYWGLGNKIVWSPWFPIKEIGEKWQLNNKLKNEYREQ